MSRPPSYTALRHGAFARYIGGEAISMVGSWMQMFAQAWVITMPALHPTALKLGGLQFVTGIPMLLLALAGGSLADRADKRLIMHASLLVQMGCALVIGWLIGNGQIAVWHLYVAGALLGTSAAFEVPAVSAFVPELVPREEMAGAIAIDRVIFHATRLLGPALGGYLVGRFGASMAYYVNAATFLALIAALLTIRRRPRGTEEEEEKRQGSILAGVRYVRADEPTRAMVLLIAAMTVFVSPFLMILMPIYSRQLLEFDLVRSGELLAAYGVGSLTVSPGLLGYATRVMSHDAELMGRLMAVSGVGSLTGALGVLSIGRSFRATALKLGAGATVLALAGMATAHSFAWAAGSIILLTLGLSTCFGLSNIVVQERAPDELRGRVSAVSGLAFFGIIPFSGVLISESVDLAGLQWTMYGCAAAYGVTTLVLLFGRKKVAPPETMSSRELSEAAS